MDKGSIEHWNWDAWNNETSLRTVSLAARGLWIEILCIMHRASPRGTLSTANGHRLTSAALARVVGSTEAEVTDCLKELEEARVFSRLLDDTIINRRMYRKTVVSEMRSEIGKLGAEARWAHGKPMAKQNNKSMAKSTGVKHSKPITKRNGKPMAKSPKTAQIDLIPAENEESAEWQTHGKIPGVGNNKRMPLKEQEQLRKTKNNSSIIPKGLILSFTPRQKITFNFQERGWENLSQLDYDEWTDAFPACEIIAELQKMKSWLLADPKRKKVQYKRFIVSWLSRQQDKGGTKGSARSTGDRAKKWAEGEK